MLRVILLSIVALAIGLSPASARQHHRHVASRAVVAVDLGCNIIFPCEGVGPSPRGERVVRAMGGFGTAVQTYTPPGQSQVVGGRPAGCPNAFCGCGASLHKFGRIIPELNLASNWYKFPRAAPAPGMAAVRPHHVFIIEAVLGDGMVMAYDANSGGHATRIHPRSLRGYTVVNPQG